MRSPAKSVAGSGVERKRKRKKVHHDSSESEGGSDKEWNDEDDNEYICFINEFLFGKQGPNTSAEGNDDDEVDPEYDIMEEEEEHDSEEFRRDPAVKISKKELDELFSELSDEFFLPKNDEAFGDQAGGCGPQVTSARLSGEAKKEDPVMTDIVQGKIKHQLQMHIQLLAQMYVLTANCSAEAVKPLAKESKKLILELNSNAVIYGPKSLFNVKNISYAASLVNSWPASGTSRSPIKKKILEERYRNEVILIPGGNGQTFTREVVRIISGSKAFMYPELLPRFPNMISDARVNFTPDEDALIAIALREMNDKMYGPLKTKHKSKLINELLLPGRRVHQIYYRIKNARKSEKSDKKVNCGLQLLRKLLYSSDPIPSPLDSWRPELLEREAVEPTNQPTLPALWVSLLKKMTIDAMFKEDPESIDVKPKKMRTRKSNNAPSKAESSPAVKQRKRTSKKSLIENQFKNEQNLPPLAPQRSGSVFDEVERVPVLDKNGSPAAYIIIPKKFYRNVAPVSAVVPASPSDNSSSELSSKDLDSSESFSNNKSLDESPSSGSINNVAPIPVTIPFSLPSLAENYPGSLVNVNSPLKTQALRKPEETDCSTSFEISSKRSNTRRNSCVTKVAQKQVLIASAHEGSKGIIPVLPLKVERARVDADQEANADKSREDHSARTWIYIRKTAEEVAATIEGKLHPALDAAKRRPENRKKIQPRLNGTSSGGSSASSRQSSRNLKRSLKTSEASPSSQPVDSGDQKTDDKSSQTNPSSKTKSGSSSSSRAPRTKKESKNTKSTAGDGGDGEDQDNRDKRRKSPLKKLKDDTDHQEEDTEDDAEEREAETRAPPKPCSSKSLTPKAKSDAQTTKAKRVRRSPGSQTKKRASKFKTTEIQKLLDAADSEVDIEEIETAFAEEFWAKCQHTLDPSLYNNLVQVFSEFGDKYSSEEEVFSRVEEMLKDYPDLLVDLATMIEPQLLQKNNLLKDNYVVQAYIRFMHLLECPQLRAKALQKIRGLRDLERVTEKDVQELVDLYFQGNPIMTDAVKAMFPNIFLPQSTVRAEDFEEINFDDPPQTDEGMAMEYVNFPEETTIPATGSCPCDCHTDPKNVNFHTKAKHCRKCCIKFQDGKVFMHSGRLMKQVNIEFTTREKAEEILAKRACGHCFEPIKGAAVVSPKRRALDKTPKKRGSRAKLATTISDVDSEPDLRKALSNNVVPSTSKMVPVQVLDQEIRISAKSLPKAPPKKEEDLEEGEIVDEDERVEDENVATTSAQRDKSPQVKFEASKTVNNPSGKPGEKRAKADPQKSKTSHTSWTIDEDRVLLQTCQLEANPATAFEKILLKKLIPHKTLDEIKERFSFLVTMIMKTKENEAPKRIAK